MGRVLLIGCAVLFFTTNVVSAQSTIRVRLLELKDRGKLVDETERIAAAIHICSISMAVSTDVPSRSSARIGNQEVKATVHLAKNTDGLQLTIDVCHVMYDHDGQSRQTNSAYSSGVPVTHNKETILTMWREGRKAYCFTIIVKKAN